MFRVRAGAKARGSVSVRLGLDLGLGLGLGLGFQLKLSVPVFFPSTIPVIKRIEGGALTTASPPGDVWRFS